MESGNEWLDTFLQYDFDGAYFNNVDSSNGSDLNDDDWRDLECDNEEEEAEFNVVNPIVGEMNAYMQQNFDKQPMRTSMLIESGYMDELYKGNPLKCYEMFCMTRPLLIHLVDELNQDGYLWDKQGGVNATQSIAMLLYILGHNTHYKCVADRFQHSIKTVSHHFC